MVLYMCMCVLEDAFMVHNITLYRRAQAMDNGLKKAIEVPLSLMTLAHGCWPHMMTLAQHGNITTLSDLKVTLIIIIQCHTSTYIFWHFGVTCISLNAGWGPESEHGHQRSLL